MSSREKDTIIHLFAGGTAGTVGAVVTCPLEVVKTRLQSSTAFISAQPSNGTKGRLQVSTSTTTTTTNNSSLANTGPGTTTTTVNTEGRMKPDQRRRLCTTILRKRPPQVITISSCGMSSSAKSMSIVQCLKHIVETEGARALFKGLGPNIVGVAPSRAIYFCAYSQSKSFLNSLGPIPSNSPIVHILSASSAGFFAATATNPIWFVKTRLQLDHQHGEGLSVRQCVANIYQQSGLRGFYKGITASYFGISETVIHFVIYEALKAKLVELRAAHPSDSKSSKDFVEFMVAGAVSKTVASCITYPHEVARTRLREEGNKYRSFWQTLHTVWKEEGKAGLYRGLATQLVRQIPNTAIMMATYEAVVYVLTRNFNS